MGEKSFLERNLFLHKSDEDGFLRADETSPLQKKMWLVLQSAPSR